MNRPVNNTTSLTLYRRKSCPLCDDMRAALWIACDTMNVARTIVREIDIDSNPELVARYDWDVPVLAQGSHVLCKHFFDAAAVTPVLAALAP